VTERVYIYYYYVIDPYYSSCCPHILQGQSKMFRIVSDLTVNQLETETATLLNNELPGQGNIHLMCLLSRKLVTSAYSFYIYPKISSFLLISRRGCWVIPRVLPVNQIYRM